MLLKNSFRLLVCVSLAAGIISAYAWSSQPIRCEQNIRGVISSHQQQSLLSADVTHNYKNRNNVLLSVALAISIITVTTTTNPCIVVADDYESPTIFTGETVMICTKRGFNGACLKTEVRTPENDNDKSNKYMKRQLEPEDIVRAKEQALRAEAANEDGSDLLEKLLQQTLENKEKNEKIIRKKTMENDEGANFGPFSRSVVILNKDGETYTLLESPQAMRLKAQGYIKDRQFIEQPSQDVIDAALLPSDSEGIQGIFQWLGIGKSE